MFEEINRCSWLATTLPAIVRSGLTANTPISAFPNGLFERLDPVPGRVATGQQPGFGGGPLYSVYKRWTAEYLSNHDRNRCFYWIEAGDSDWNEIARIETEKGTIHWEDRDVGVPVGARVMPPDFVEKLTGLWSNIDRNMLNPFVHSTILDAFQAAHQLFDPDNHHSQWYPGPPFLSDADSIRFRALIADWFERLTEGKTALLKGISRVETDFGHAQATLHGNRTGWFYCKTLNSRRFPVESVDSDTYVIDDVQYSAHDLSEYARSDDGYFIPGALWRIVVQQALLQPEAVVVGTSEAAYWGEVAELFHWAGQPFPKLVIRVGGTILPVKYRTLGCSELLSATPPELPVSGAWKQLNDQIESLSQTLEQLQTDLPQHLTDAVAKGSEKAIYQLHRILELGQKYRDEQTGSRRKLWEQAQTLLLGSGSKAAQERWCTLLEANLRWGGSGLSDIQSTMFSTATGGRVVLQENH